MENNTVFTEISAEEFDAFSAVHPYTSFQQTSGWAELKGNFGWRKLFLALKKNDQIVAAALFLGRRMPVFNKFLYYSPHGYLIDYKDTELLKEFQQAAEKKLKQERGFLLIIDPYYELCQRDIEGQVVEGGFDNHDTVEELKSLGFTHTGYNLYYENLQPRFLFRLNVADKSYQELVNDFRYETKRRIRKKDQLAIHVRELEKKDIPIYKELMARTGERRGFIDRPLSYYEKMYDCLHPSGILHFYGAEIDFKTCLSNVEKEIAQQQEKIEKLSAKNPDSPKTKNRVHEEEIVLNKAQELRERVVTAMADKGDSAVLSVVCILDYGQEAIMLLAGNDEDYLQDFNTSNIIVAELIRITKEKGYRYYNFYGITGDFSPENDQYGLYTYKKQYGGEVVELIGQFEKTLDPFTAFCYRAGHKLYQIFRKKH
ncbi:MAG: peptidoglycan bridge formation glycyltransferase FemA/FemB family protein [Erysipelotrichaceae bacterium]|nr:peptidoglycan bridge formation glycyltransferase FemA/FemB family protein [Erysipelotrichaceae bacterium]